MNNTELKEIFVQKQMQTVKDGNDILKSISPKKLEILHSSHDLSEEVGELQNAIKRHIFYNQELDRRNVIEEFGDILGNVHKLMNHLNISEEVIYESNIDKVSKRYPEGYNDKSAELRADKVGTKCI